MLFKFSYSFFYTQKWPILCFRIPVLQSKQVILIRSTPTYLRCIANQARSKYDQPTLYRRSPRSTPLNIRPVESGIIPNHFSTGWKTYPAHPDLSERVRPTPAVFKTNIRSPRSKPAHCRSVHFSRAGESVGWSGLWCEWALRILRIPKLDSTNRSIFAITRVNPDISVDLRSCFRSIPHCIYFTD